ncbi:unnamed protein product [Cylicostephanus goldi]|uniref:Uncharacterized protein n=1 Tax=Cylicostephanus goldi TaxID=71465 RepID=A0A3P6RYZ5_CYLGO|nr:unnamed protein product [Cylicostephanus goldi]
MGQPNSYAHKIVDCKLFDDLPNDAFRVPDVEKVAAVAKREAGVREMAYCQVPAFQHDLEKIVEEIRNGGYPLTAFAPLAHPPLKSTVPSSRVPATASTVEEPSTSSLTNTQSHAAETSDAAAAAPAAAEESVSHSLHFSELTIWLQLEDMMNRQLTTEFSNDEDPLVITHDLVKHGFICEVSSTLLRLHHLLVDIVLNDCDRKKRLTALTMEG